MKLNTEAFIKRKEEIEKQLMAEGQALVKDVLKQFFDEFPEVEALRWRQYTPHFNDGEPCVFNVHDIYAKLKDGKEDDGNYDDGFQGAWNLKDKDNIAEGLKEIGKLFGSTESGMRSAFGDGFKVTAKRDGIEVEEYDHD